ncbi:MAG: leucine-rich repeat protein, partial [Clostridia bacterium]|nr:leucine-rich repeat protein [Clostridia bacterium]
FFNGDRGRNFSKITVDPENQYYTEKGNCLIRIADKFLMCAFADSVIPDDGSVEIIGSVAFLNKPGLTSVVIPEGVVKITSGAFKNNYELVSVSIPTTIKKMSGAFGFDSMTEFKYAGTVEQWHKLAKSSTPYWTESTSLTQVTCSDGVVELEFDKRGRVIVDY